MSGLKRLSRQIVFLLLAAFFLLPAGGCARKSHIYKAPVVDAESGMTSMEAVTSYSPEDFPDIIIPVELNYEQEDSLIVRSDAYAAAVLKYSGRVEVNSLADYFINELAKQGWKLAGSVRYEETLLAFAKPGKTCTVNIVERGLTNKTWVNISITDDVASRKQFQVPFGAETLK